MDNPEESNLNPLRPRHLKFKLLFVYPLVFASALALFRSQSPIAPDTMVVLFFIGIGLAVASIVAIMWKLSHHAA